MPEPVLLFFIFLLSLLLTGILRHYALQKGVMDVPNHRSSHVTPTPRWGGVAMVASFTIALMVLLILEQLCLGTFLALAGSGGLAAAVGARDDYRSLSPSRRLLIHFGAAAWGLYWLGGMPEITVAGFLVMPGWPVNLIGLVFLVWFLNLYNFMDGIDGLAATEAVFVSGAAAFIIWLRGGDDTFLLVLFSFSCLGFLFWNWPPARIFMGDAGSGFLGIILALFAIHTSHTPSINLWTWLILAGFFIIDATLTLFRRIFSGSTWYKAHKSHCYQILSRRWQSHGKVTVLVSAVNLVWLLPMALLSALNPSSAFIYTLVAWLPLACLVVITGAGTERS